MIGVVLAGGLSRRMGRDKAQLLWQGQPLLEYMQDLLSQAACNEVVVSGLADFPDRLQDAGPLAGIARLLEAFPGYRLVFVPVDMPLLKADDLSTLLRAEGTVYFNRSYLPLAVDANQQALESIQQCLLSQNRRERSVRAWLEMNLASSIEIDDERRLSNANTPEQWQQLLLLQR